MIVPYVISFIQIPEDHRRNFTKMYNVRRLSEMAKIIPDVNWRDYFGWMVSTNQHYLAEDPEVIVTEPGCESSGYQIVYSV